jgi:hypothetical protein
MLLCEILAENIMFFLAYMMNKISFQSCLFLLHPYVVIFSMGFAEKKTYFRHEYTIIFYVMKVKIYNKATIHAPLTF